MFLDACFYTQFSEEKTMKKPVKTIDQKLRARKIHKPPYVIYNLLGRIWQLLYQKKLNFHYEYKVDPRKTKGSYIVISNHASRMDYIYTGIPLLPHTFNYVAGYNEFFRSHLAFIFRLLQIIPKKNFTPDLYAILQVSRIIKKGGRIVLFPEGMSSISGANQPSALGSGKFLKHYGVPVFVFNIKGGYLTSTKYCLDERPGRVDVVIDQLFTPEQLKTMSENEIQLKIDEAIHHDDYAWNKKEKVAFQGNSEMAKNMGDLLYRCPRCHHDFVMKGEGDVIKCTHCGNGATVNERYDFVPLDDKCVIPETPVAWYNEQRDAVHKEISDPAFEMSEPVELGMLPSFEYLKDQKTAVIVGKGKVVLNRQGFTYVGTKNGEPFTFHLSSAEVPTFAMCTDVTRFYTFYFGEFYEFYPKANIVMKFLLAAEEIHRLNGGKWKDFPEALKQKK